MAIYRSKAPLRISLGGGGTDVSPYSDYYGGAVLNATINMYAYATIEPRDDKKVVLHTIGTNEKLELLTKKKFELDGKLDLIKGVYNRLVKDFTGKPLSFELSTYVDAPPGSGLGASSTLVTAIIGVFCEWLKLPLGEYDIAHLAYEIERIDVGQAGGKQDQYTATFGGFNFMEFYESDRVIVNPLRIKQKYLNEIQLNLLLYYTGISRFSSNIIESQSKNVQQGNIESIEAMHKLKKQAGDMKEAILTGNINKIGEILDFGWKFKKQTAKEITNPRIDEIYTAAMAHGATGGKISGAGGGGYMMLYCPGNTRHKVIESLKAFPGEYQKFEFTEDGLTAWSVNE